MPSRRLSQDIDTPLNSCYKYREVNKLSELPRLNPMWHGGQPIRCRGKRLRPPCLERRA